MPQKDLLASRKILHEMSRNLSRDGSRGLRNAKESCPLEGLWSQRTLRFLVLLNSSFSQDCTYIWSIFPKPLWSCCCCCFFWLGQKMCFFAVFLWCPPCCLWANLISILSCQAWRCFRFSPEKRRKSFCSLICNFVTTRRLFWRPWLLPLGAVHKSHKSSHTRRSFSRYC